MDELTRFARKLVEQLGATRDGLTRPVSIGEVRERILPYRTHRRALQVESVEDYETVLLRLVSGERGFVRTMPADAGERCRAELAGPNPDLTVLDLVADSTIQFTSIAAGQIVGDEDGASQPVPPPAAPKPSRAASAPPPAPAPTPPPPPAARAAKESTPMSAERCAHQVPAGRKAVFCPWCGERLIPFTCPRCQTELDSAWRHCITCGAPVKDPHYFA